MKESFVLFLLLLLAIVGLIMLTRKIKVAYPILLVLGGLLISFVPGLPRLELDPELIFIIFLPPILYEAAWMISLKELIKWRRIILSFAFLVVFVTAAGVAFTAYCFIPGFTLGLGFLLGGIVSPPDAVSVNAITKFVTVPKRFSSILEGESLLNDASSLIILQFAVLAVMTGEFHYGSAALSFLWMVIGGVGIGLLVGWLFMKIHRIFPTGANVDVVLTLIAPYIIYIAAEEAHSSGILAVVSAGLLLSKNKYKFLSSSSRVQGLNVWGNFVFMLNGIVFMLIGLDLPQIVGGLGDTSLKEAIGYGVLITIAIILVRLICAYAAVGVTLIMRNFITVADPNPPGSKVPFILGWTGMRGVVSLAAALSVPLYLQNGEAFPQRNLILFITFVVILLTLVVQGLTLPFIIKRAGLKETDYPQSEVEVSVLLQKEMKRIAFKVLNDRSSHKMFGETVCNSVTEYVQTRLKEEETLEKEEEKLELNRKAKTLYGEIINQQREYLLQLNRTKNDLDEEIVNKQLLVLDYEEEQLRLRG